MEASTDSASYQALKGAIRDELERSGKLRSMRAELYHTLFDQTTHPDDPAPDLTADRLLLNDLVREYLDFSGYHHAAKVLLAESGQPTEPLQRDYLAEKLNLPQPKAASTDSRPPLPLLYSLLSSQPAQRSISRSARALHARSNAASRGSAKTPLDAKPDRMPEPIPFTGGRGQHR